MKNICVIGNSHAASIISAWKELSHGFPDINLTFFAHPSTGLFNLTTCAESLVPTSHLLEKSFPINSGGKSKIDIVEYDSFLLYGLLDPNDFLFSENEFISAAVLENLCQDIEENNLAFFVSELLRQITDKKIYFGLAPYKAHRGQMDDGIQILSESNISPAFESLAARYSLDFVFQPANTIVKKKYTIEDFRRKHPNLNIGNEIAFKQKATDDLKHMNKEYGVLWLKNMLGGSTLVE